MNNFISGVMMGIGIALILKNVKSVIYHLKMLIRGLSKLFKL